MDKQVLQALLRSSGLFNRMQQAGIEKLTIEQAGKADGQDTFNVELYRRNKTDKLPDKLRTLPFMSVGDVKAHSKSTTPPKQTDKFLF